MVRVGSNFFLTDRRLVPEYNQGFAELCAPPPAQSHPRLNFADSRSVGVQGIEPCTSCSQNRRSTDELDPVSLCST